MSEAVLTSEQSLIIAQKERRKGLFWDAFRRMRKNRAAIVSLVALVVLGLAAIFADVIVPYSPSEQFFEAASGANLNPLDPRATGKYEPPSAEHIFGTDHLARDIFSRTVVGLRISLSAALFGIIVVTVIGVLVGTLAATGPRFMDDLLMRGTDVAFAFPDLLLMILLRSAFGTTIFGMNSIAGIDSTILLLFLAISLTAWPTIARLVRGQLLSIREQEYATAAIAVGASPARVAFRHLLPNALTPVIVEVTFLVPRLIFAEAALSFIGIGISPPTPSLGILLADHFRFVRISWTALAIPCAVLATLYLSFNFFGDGLRDALDPRTR